MAKLYYNIYTHIGDERYIELEKQLLPVERELRYNLGIAWNLTESVKTCDALIIDFTRRDREGYYYNIGVALIDKLGEPAFDFYVTKAFDEDNARYFIKTNIFHSRSIAFLIDNTEHFIDKALKQLDYWSKEVIIKEGSVERFDEY